MKFIKLLTLFFIIHTNMVNAQTAAEQKAQELIDALNKTEFVQQYQEYKNNIELDVAEFKLIQADLQERDVKRVQLYFNQSRLKFDGILTKLETDLTNRTTRKTIVQNPQRYTKTLQDDLAAAVNYYDENCKKLMETLTEKDSAMDMETLQGLFDSVLGLVQLFKATGENANQLSLAYLEKEFIQPLRLKKWEEIL
ncbi:MAG: hypothetical protein IPH16_01485 [Haliscomenobacter sp.]|nr:hypothetical protein [Haliscomenobacter sp.]MBK7477287.1 hypothetical protein [Haliscomenobacter sp.]MBK8878561.1 hypothetical protein [Haliscomenobacter sp.]